MGRIVNLIPSCNLAVLLALLVSVQLYAATEMPSDSNIISGQQSRPNLPFGHSLFSGDFSSQSSAALDPNYIIAPGDKVSLQIWGAIQANEVVSVDSQGNLFIPEVGAVQVAGIAASELPGAVKRKLRSVYKDGVDAYVNLLTSTPIRIFVTGPVVRPGQYTGSQSDSVISYLHKAGGILARQGSYRDIRILRRGKKIASVDLYSFLRWGQLPRLTFKDGDTLLVTPQHSTASVSGDARGSYLFEFTQRTSLGRELMNIARPNPSVTNVAVSGSRNGQPWSAYLPLSSFRQSRIYDGDIIRFITDSANPTIDITVEGSHLGNSLYKAKRGTRLLELLDYIAISPDEADIHNIYIKRKSLAEKQLKNIEESITRLERSVLTSPLRTSSEATIRQQESALVAQLAKTARAMKPEGRIVVSEYGEASNIRLEAGDVIVIPYRSDVITISGEINLPQTVVYATNANVYDYISKSGGFTDRANQQEIIVRKPNGQTVLSGLVSPGDEIIVFPKVDTKKFQFAKDIMSIIFQIAATTKAVGIL